MSALRNSVRVALVALLCACTPESAKENALASAARGAKSEVLSLTTAPTPQEPAALPWYTGSWSGVYEARKHDPLAGRNAGQQMAWIKDSGKSFAGPGLLEAVIDAEGNVSGTGSGALGGWRLGGRASDKWVHITVQPQQDTGPAFAGTATGSIEKSQIVLELRLASADGHLIRSATATLKKSDEP